MPSGHKKGRIKIPPGIILEIQRKEYCSKPVPAGFMRITAVLRNNFYVSLPFQAKNYFAEHEFLLLFHPDTIGIIRVHYRSPWLHH